MFILLVDTMEINNLLFKLQSVTVSDSPMTLNKLAKEAAEEIQNLRSLVNELLPYMLNDMTQGLAIGPSDHCKDAQAPCTDCQWYEDASLWKKRLDAGEFKGYSL